MSSHFVDASDCLQGFANIRSLPSNVTTSDVLLYKVLPPGLHLFPNVKFLCDGSVQRLKFVLFYTAAVNNVWEKLPWVELLLSSGGHHRECTGNTLNCIIVRQNLSEKVKESELFNLGLVTHGCEGQCIVFQKNTILTLSVEFNPPRTVKRGDHIGLYIPRLLQRYEDALPIIYTGSNFESPFIAFLPGSFIPSREFDQHLMLKYMHVLSIGCRKLHDHNMAFGMLD